MLTNLSEHKMFWNYIMVNVLKFIGLFHAFGIFLTFECSYFLKYLVEWQTV